MDHPKKERIEIKPPTPNPAPIPTPTPSLTLPYSATYSSQKGEAAFEIKTNGGGGGLVRAAFGQNPVDNSYGVGVQGVSDGGRGVMGTGTQGIGVEGVGRDIGVRGASNGGIGVFGSNGTGDGVQGQSSKNGVHGISASPTDSGVWGENQGSRGQPETSVERTPGSEVRGSGFAGEGRDQGSGVRD